MDVCIMYDIVCSYRKLNGACTSLFDIYYNFVERSIPITFNMVLHTNGRYDIIYYKDEYPKIPYKRLMKLKFDTLIVSADFIGQDWELFKTFSYKNLIIIDSSKIYIDRIKYDNITAQRINSIDNKIVLGNKFNSQFINSDYEIWYHKLSKVRLNYIKNKYNTPLYNDTLHRNNNDDFFPIMDKHPSFHNYTEYFYHRYRTWDNGVTYIENIGKMIFEYLYCGKSVIYSPKNKTMDDGLTEYLNLFGIDDNKEQKLFITKEDIENKLFMNDNDLLLRLI